MAETGQREAQVTATMAWLLESDIPASAFNETWALVEALTPVETLAMNDEEGGQ